MRNLPSYATVSKQIDAYTAISTSGVIEIDYPDLSTFATATEFRQHKSGTGRFRAPALAPDGTPAKLDVEWFYSLAGDSLDGDGPIEMDDVTQASAILQALTGKARRQFRQFLSVYAIEKRGKAMDLANAATRELVKLTCLLDVAVESLLTEAPTA